MGQFCGTIFVRGAEVVNVVAACAAIAARGDTKFLVAPPERSWVPVYPSDSGQNEEISQELASRLGGDVLHLMLHDSDVVAYVYFIDGEPADAFSSTPDYFGEVSEEEHRALRGDSERLRVILPPETSMSSLEELLSAIRKPAPGLAEAFRAHADFRNLGDALGLPVAETSYEILQDGPARARAGMQHLPNPEEAWAAKRVERAQVKTERARLARSGALLLTLGRKSGAKNDPLHPDPIFTPDPAGGILVSWSRTLFGQEPVPLVRYASPWGEPPRETGIRFGTTAYSIVLSPSGRQLAVGHASGRWSVELWDFERRELRKSVPAERAGRVFAFSPEESLLAIHSEQHVRILEVESGNERFAFEAKGNEQLAFFHPSGSHLLYARSPDLVIFDLRSGSEVAALRSSERRLGEWMAAAQRGEGVNGFWPHELPLHGTFNDAGDLLALGTDDGPRIYRWRELLECRREFPTPVRAAKGEVVTVAGQSRMRSTFSVVFDSRDRLFYCGLEGRIGVLGGDAAGSALSMEIPGRPPLFHARRTGEGEALALIARPGMFERKRQPAELQVWSFDGIVASAIPTS